MTRCTVEGGELSILSEEDTFAANARIGLGMSVVLGALYFGRKLLKR